MLFMPHLHLTAAYKRKFTAGKFGTLTARERAASGLFLLFRFRINGRAWRIAGNREIKKAGHGKPLWGFLSEPSK
jgi:hypothetical protein